MLLLICRQNEALSIAPRADPSPVSFEIFAVHKIVRARLLRAREWPPRHNQAEALPSAMELIMHRTDAIAWVVSVCASTLRLSQAKTLAILVASALRVQRIPL